MNALLALFAGNPSPEAFEPVFNGKNSLELAVERAGKFPGVGKTALFASGGDFSFLENVQIERRETWTKRGLLERIAELQAGFDCAYFAFADCPFYDPALAAAVAERHTRYGAEYSYADGWPFGLAPEMLSPGTAAILAKIAGDDAGLIEEDFLFSVLQKDINAFDIETEISPADLRCHRLRLRADSKRNFALLKNFMEAAGGKIPLTADVEKIVAERPQILRTLPAFYPVQVYGGCPQSCSLCPYPAHTDALGRKDYMDGGKFESLLDKITAFSGDAVIDLSLWGELSLHPEKMKLIEKVLSRPELALVIETSGLGWKNEELEKCAGITRSSAPRKNKMPPLSWIVSLDAVDGERYKEARGRGYAEALDCVKTLFSLFPEDGYVQAVRTAGAEDDIEKFYRYWKDNAPSGEKNIIIQKYDDFCGALPKKQASDISPVIRQPCWHLMRDMPVLIDGTALLCREELAILRGANNGNNRVLGNVFTSSLESVWENKKAYYEEHCRGTYADLCSGCDEYYTYNF
ncbi:MAG: spiro-SPASM protein [Treponema sp.]|jgi:spiro-SPASM protein|nr:spiro-SPASM protein [Treponema sp.]